ncbi:MAG: FHA domain-containing protein, partial [Planctomycetes bacterium]|nr:FHA domain-containing protein [Planctomycetota bacterium]
MTKGTQAIQRLWFEPVIGPDLEGFWLEPGQDLLFGRGSQCEIKLPEATISRQHGRLISSEEGCFLVDLGSRLGSFVNDTQCQKDANSPITTGDMIRIGPWTFRASVRKGAPVSMQTIDDSIEV